jgi:hypothetical protein
MDEWTQAELQQRLAEWGAELERIKSRYAHPAYKHELQKAIDEHVKGRPNWWVCQMHGGGYFAIQLDTMPDGGTIQGNSFTIPANSYNIEYGACSQREADEFIADVES